MPKRITVTALKPVQYDGRSHVRGAVFTTTPIDAASLKYRGLVKFGGELRAASGSTVPDHPSISRRLERDILRQDGPTFEDYVRAGYAPAAYPPQGYAEKPSAGLDAYRASLLEPPKAAADEAPQDPSTPAPAPAPLTEAPVETAEAPSPEAASEPKEAAKRGRGGRYNRRDMRADTGE